MIYIYKKEDKQLGIVRREIAEARLELERWEKKTNSPYRNVQIKKLKEFIEEKEIIMKELLAKIRLRSRFR
jgi:hypothetical protein